MDSTFTADRFFIGLFEGAMVAWLLTVGLDYSASYFPWWTALHPALRVILEVGIAAVLTLTRPMMLRFMWPSRRKFYFLNEDMHAMLLGRTVGVIAGVLMSTAVNN
jgi:hypothetical protein